MRQQQNVLPVGRMSQHFLADLLQLGSFVKPDFVVVMDHSLEFRLSERLID
jgi:hypothetical protein